jgi:hypothetical protein
VVIRRGDLHPGDHRYRPQGAKRCLVAHLLRLGLRRLGPGSLRPRRGGRLGKCLLLGLLRPPRLERLEPQGREALQNFAPTKILAGSLAPPESPALAPRADGAV